MGTCKLFIASFLSYNLFPIRYTLRFAPVELSFIINIIKYAAKY